MPEPLAIGQRVVSLGWLIVRGQRVPPGSRGVVQRRYRDINEDWQYEVAWDDLFLILPARSDELSLESKHK